MTIIEVVVAAFLLVTVVVGLFGVISASTRSDVPGRGNPDRRSMSLSVRWSCSVTTRLCRARDDVGAGAATRDRRQRSRRAASGRQGLSFASTGSTGRSLPDPSLIAAGLRRRSARGLGASVVDSSASRPGPRRSRSETSRSTSTASWSGRTKGNQLLPPGLPLCRRSRCTSSARPRTTSGLSCRLRPRRRRVRTSARTRRSNRTSSTPTGRRSTPSRSGPGGGDVVTGQQFWLSDTRCQTGRPSRRGRPPPKPRDPRHAWDCALPGQQPDALLTAPPLDPDPDDEDNPPFSTARPSSSPPALTRRRLPARGRPVDCDPDDRGLQMLDQDGSAPRVRPGGRAHRKIHRWVSVPMAGRVLDFVMTDKARLSCGRGRSTRSRAPPGRSARSSSSATTARNRHDSSRPIRLHRRTGPPDPPWAWSACRSTSTPCRWPSGRCSRRAARRLDRRRSLRHPGQRPAVPLRPPRGREPARGADHHAPS